MSEGWLERLQAERDEVRERRRRLDLWLMDEDNHRMVSHKELGLMVAQSYAMAAYLDILNIRLTHAERRPDPP
jgi:hypothetical protein